MSTDTETAHSTGTPTRTSTAIVLAVSLLLVALLVGQVEPVLAPALAGIAGAGAFALSLWLLSLSRYDTVAATATSLLTVAVAIGLLVGVFGTVLTLVGDFFPVETTAALSLRSLLLLSRVGIVVGCVCAVLGVLLGIRNVVDGETLTAYYWVSLKTALVPTLVGAGMVASAYLSHGGQDAGTLLGAGIVAGLRTWLLGPATAATHLATFAGLVTLAAVSVRGAVGALPVAELLADSGSGETSERQVARVRSALGWLAVAGAIGAVVLAAVETGTEPSQLRRAVGDTLYGLLAGVSTTAVLRWLLVLVTVGSVLTVVAMSLLRRAARGSARSFARRAVPVGGGALVTAVAALFAGPILRPLVRWVDTQLPDAFAAVFRTSTRTFVDFFGAPAIVVVLAAILVTVTALVVLLVRFAVFAGYLAEETVGYSLASGGLFVGTAFAGTVGAPAWLVFGGLVGSLLVWDVGRYGTTLGEEIGRVAPSRDAELVHAGGTLAVGLVGAGLAYAVATVFKSGGVATTPASVVALMGVLVGIVFLVAALR
jgi:hypothetical protein